MSAPYLPRRLALADEFWFLSHRDFGPGAFVADNILGVGLAGALIGELALAGYVMLRDGRVIPVQPPAEAGQAAFPRHAVDGLRTPPPPPQQGLDPLLAAVMSEIAARPALYPVADWIAFLADAAGRRVAGRLEAAGLVTAVGGRLRRRTWEPVDASTASSPAVALRYHARNRFLERDGVDAQTAMLAGLALATNLTKDIDVDDTMNLQQALLVMVNTLHDDLLALIRGVQDSVTALTRQIRR